VFTFGSTSGSGGGGVAWLVLASSLGSLSNSPPVDNASETENEIALKDEIRRSPRIQSASPRTDLLLD
jgi:hypothetical protein